MFHGETRSSIQPLDSENIHRTFTEIYWHKSLQKSKIGYLQHALIGGVGENFLSLVYLVQYFTIQLHAFVLISFKIVYWNAAYFVEYFFVLVILFRPFRTYLSKDLPSNWRQQIVVQYDDKINYPVEVNYSRNLFCMFSGFDLLLLLILVFLLNKMNDVLSFIWVKHHHYVNDFIISGVLKLIHFIYVP